MSRLLGSLSAEARPADQSPWLEDEFVACYASWRMESTSVRLAYEHWKDAEPSGESAAHAAYVAALDREERAADVYRDCARRVAGGS
jgi:hypothetical protein